MPLTRLLLQRLLPALLLIALANRPVHASTSQGVPIQNFTVQEGLPDNMVLAIAQETGGRFWVATETGISEYLAGRFRADKIGDLALTPARAFLVIPHPISDTHMDSFYIGGETGLKYRSPSGEWLDEILTGSGLEQARVNALFADGEGTVWVGTDSYLARCTEDLCHQVVVDGLPLPINAVTGDPSGHIWVGGEGNDVAILVNEKRVALLTPEDGIPSGCSVNALLADVEGNVWLGTNLGLVRIIDQQVMEVLSEAQGLVSSLILSLLPASSGGIWIGSSTGLQRWVAGDWVETYTIRDQLAGAAVNILFYDQEGNLWAGTNGGLSRFHISAWQPETHSLIDLNSIHAILPKMAGNSYVITEQGIVTGRPGGAWRLVPGSDAQTFYCLEEDARGTVWACGHQGLYSIQSGRLVPDPRIPPGQLVSALVFDRQGTAWAGTDTGLLHLVDEQRAVPVDDPAVSGKAISTLWITRAGDLWVGLSNGGASRLRDGVWLSISTLDGGLASNFIYDGLENADGSLWFATLEGLSILAAGENPKSESGWIQVGIPQNLPSGFSTRSYRNNAPVNEWLEPALSSLHVNALVGDKGKPGMVWAGTENGLDLIQGRLSSTFDVEDGLGSNTILSLAQTPDGRLWVGTAFGMFYHRDQGIAPRLSAPAWNVNGEPYNPGTMEPLVYSQKTAWIEYPASDLNDLTGIMYRLEVWQLKGNADPKPPEVVETRQSSHELTLSPGSQYTVKVTAYDREMNPSSLMTSPTLKVNQITWLEWLAAHPLIATIAILAAALAFASMFYLGFRWWRLRQQKAFPLVISARLYLDPESRRIDVDWHARRRFKKEQGAHPLNLDVSAFGRIEQQVRELIGRDPALLRQLGEPLWQALFSPEEERQLLDLKIGQWPGRLYLSIAQECPEYGFLPWEYAFGGQGLGHVLQDKNPLSLARLSMAAQAHPSFDAEIASRKYSPVQITSQRKLRILLAWANPRAAYLGNLRYLEKEMEVIKAAIENSRHAADIECKELPHVTWDTFEEQVRNGYDVVHFTGHAGVFVNKKVLFFELEEGPRPKSLMDLVHLFECRPETISRGSALVVLNACRSAEASVSGGPVGLAESLTSLARVPCAVGMGYPISEDSGMVFSSAFYSALLKQGQIDHAMTEARKALSNHEPGRRDWGIPRLYLREEINSLFEWS